MRPQGRVIVVDPMLPDDNSPHPNWLVDTSMLVVQGGACRTERQFSVLFESTGSAMSRVLATRSPTFISRRYRGNSLGAMSPLVLGSKPGLAAPLRSQVGVVDLTSTLAAPTSTAAADSVRFTSIPAGRNAQIALKNSLDWGALR